ncbi:5225_t:CDS:1 [Acaulospora colombiana]|uniref:5225_t:CDS:1 n=1 Tax=Acaulospora colombiana TaxID=27376 RepID=A0ACA9K409_9GLOM|nr:5225_t:CDS:1 [Acaulospora colombiana]
MSGKGQLDKPIKEREPPKVSVDSRNSTVRKRSTLISSESIILPRSVSESPYESPSGRDVPNSISPSESGSDANSSRSLKDSNNWVSSDLPLPRSQAKSSDDNTSSCSSDLPSVIYISLAEILVRTPRSNDTPIVTQNDQKREIEDSQKWTMSDKEINNGGSSIIKKSHVNEIPRRGSQATTFSSSSHFENNEGSRVRNRGRPILPNAPESSITKSLPPPITIPGSLGNFSHPVRIPGSESLERAIVKKQKQLIDLVLSLWPIIRLPPARHIATCLSPETLEKRKMFSSLTVGVIATKNGKQMVSSITIKKTKYSSVNNRQEPVLVSGVCDPREYVIKHCPTYQNPPLDKRSPDSEWTAEFLLTNVLPKLARETEIVQQQPGLLLTVKEVKMRGLEMNSLFECRKCAKSNYEKTFDYVGVIKHLQNSRHGFKTIDEEEHIKINLRAYINAFYDNLPPRIIREPLEYLRY